MQVETNIEIEKNIAHPHTIKKFELIEEYVKAWAPKLLNFPNCNGIVFIDCMCNNGLYHDSNGKKVIGTPIRVANYLHGIMKKYPGKQCSVYFNDLDQNKIEILKTQLPKNTRNFHIHTSYGDGNDLLIDIGRELSPKTNMNYLLVYDPYTASIDWGALFPFLRNWGEVIINHMVSDSIRGIPQAKRDATIEKYEQTYSMGIEELIALGNDRTTYEDIIGKIISASREGTNKKYYTSSFPFFNSKNSIVYSLIHCSRNIKGFKLYKKTAWKTFGGKSSTKNTHGKEFQTKLVTDGTEGVIITTHTDEYCYNVYDIAKHIQSVYNGRQHVPKKEIWETLDEHPFFPSDGYRPDILKILKEKHNANVSQQSVSFM